MVQMFMEAKLSKGDADLAALGHEIGPPLQSLIHHPSFRQSYQNSLVPFGLFLP
jgi:hypothetical protein